MSFERKRGPIRPVQITSELPKTIPDIRDQQDHPEAMQKWWFEVRTVLLRQGDTELASKCNELEKRIIALEAQLAALPQPVEDVDEFVLIGVGSPENQIAAPPATHFYDRENRNLWIKDTGDGKVGWVVGQFSFSLPP